MQNKFQKGGFIERTPNDPNSLLHATDIKLKDFDLSKFEKPVFVCFPGDASFSRKDANAFAKTVMNFVGDDSRVFGFFYEKQQHDRGWFSKICRKNIANALFSKTISNAKENDLKENWISNELKKLVFVSHCHGNCEVAEILNLAGEMCEKNGFDPKKALEGVSNISFAPMDLSSTDFGKHVWFLSFNDEMLPFFAHQKFLKDKRFNSMGAGKTEISENKLLFLANSFLGAEFLMKKPKNNFEHTQDLLNCDLLSITKKPPEQTRAKFVQRLFALALLSAKNGKSLSEIKSNFDVQIVDQMSTDFEKEDQKLLKEFENGFNSKKSFTQFLEEQKISESEILNGSKSLEDALEKAFVSGEFRTINFENSAVPKMFVDALTKKDGTGGNAKVFLNSSKSVFLFKPKSFEGGAFDGTTTLVLENGEFTAENVGKDQKLFLMFANFLKKPVHNAILMTETTLDGKPKIFVRPALDIKPTFARSSNDVLNSFFERKKTIVMSKEQTRVVLNTAMQKNLCLEDIVCKNSKLNGYVLVNEILPGGQKSPPQNVPITPKKVLTPEEIDQKMSAKFCSNNEKIETQKVF